MTCLQVFSFVTGSLLRKFVKKEVNILKQILYYIKNLRVYLSRRVLLVLKRAPEGQVGSKIECNPGSIHDCWLSLLRHWQEA